jgi:hypothetical protein
MGIIGNMNQYTQFQAANAMEAAATNPGGGAASEGMGMGMGMAMAGTMMNSMNQSMNQNQQQQQQGPPPMPQAVSFFAVVNGAQAGPFDANVLKQMVGMGTFTKETLVWKQGMANWTPAGQVPEMVQVFGAAPPPLPPPTPGV